MWNNDRRWRVLSSPRTVAVICISLFSVLFLYAQTTLGRDFSIRNLLSSHSQGPESPSSSPGQLRHIMIPTTTVEAYVCRLLATTIMLGYTTPKVLGWTGENAGIERFPTDPNQDPKHTLMFKLITALEYLDSLPASAQDDLAMLLDAFDAWLLLPPDIITARYHAILAASDARLATQGLLHTPNNGTPIRSTIVFGTDQACWPANDPSRPACGSIPSHPLATPSSNPAPTPGTLTYGKWLNSGVFMGPVRDLRPLLRAAVDLSRDGYAPDYHWRWDDQGCVADVWAEQEQSRTELAGGNRSLGGHADGERVREFLARRGSVERGITLDYESLLVQNAYSTDGFVEWDVYGGDREGIESVEPPFRGVGVAKGWRELVLGVNNATGHAFGVYHMTGAHKHTRKSRWPKLWFHPYGKEMLMLGNGGRPMIDTWTSAADEREWSWEDMCGAFDEELFPYAN